MLAIFITLLYRGYIWSSLYRRVKYIAHGVVSSLPASLSFCLPSFFTLVWFNQLLTNHVGVFSTLLYVEQLIPMRFLMCFFLYSRIGFTLHYSVSSLVSFVVRTIFYRWIRGLPILPFLEWYNYSVLNNLRGSLIFFYIWLRTLLLRGGVGPVIFLLGLFLLL